MDDAMSGDAEREAAVRNLATGLDIPAEILGIEGESHWGPWHEQLHGAVPVFTVGPRVAILACLSESLALRGYAPVEREIAAAVGLSNGSVHYYLEQLREQGYVTWEDGQQRTLRFAL